MYRVLPIAGAVVASLALTGCAGTWDTVTSRKFRTDPLNTTYRMMKPEDPLAVLRADPPRDGDERAKAILRLKEPVANGLSQQDQDEVIDLLAQTATAHPSPVLRLAAVEALGRFQDPRAVGILMIAYQKAHGRPDGAADLSRPESPISPASGTTGRVPGRPAAPLAPPTGYAPDTVAAIRCRALEGIGRSGRADAVPFLAAVAAGANGGSGPEGADDRDVRLAAVRGLGHCRQPDAVAALAQVLAAEQGKDAAVVGRTHDGLVRLTGQRLPADPQKWNEVVQAGAVVVPEPTWVENAFEWIKP